MKRSMAGKVSEAKRGEESLLKMGGEEFERSVMVAELSLRLYKLEHRDANKKDTKEDPVWPGDYLEAAWELIEKARGHVK